MQFVELESISGISQRSTAQHRGIATSQNASYGVPASPLLHSVSITAKRGDKIVKQKAIDSANWW